MVGQLRHCGRRDDSTFSRGRLGYDHRACCSGGGDAGYGKPSSSPELFPSTAPLTLCRRYAQEFHLWKQARDGDGDNEDVLIRTTHYSLPEHLHAHVELVQPTTYFGRPKPMSATLFFEGINITISLSPSPPPEDPGSPIPPPVNCTRTMTIDCLKYIYNIGGYQPSATNKNAIGITGYLNQYANIADLQSFYAAERPDAVNSTFKTVLVHSARALRWALLFVWEDDLTFVVCGTWQMGRTTSP